MLASEGARVGTLKEGSGVGDHTWYKGDAGAEVVVLNKLKDRRRGSRYWSLGVTMHRALVATVEEQ